MSQPDEGLLRQDDVNAALAAAGLSNQIPDEVSSEPAAFASTEDEHGVSPSVGAAASATAVADPPYSTQSFDPPELSAAGLDPATAQGIDLLRDVELDVKIELGRSRMLVEEVLRLSEGSVVELDKLAGDPVDVFVNNRLVARGEVLVLNDNFCVRINEIVARNGEEAWI